MIRTDLIRFAVSRGFPSRTFRVAAGVAAFALLWSFGAHAQQSCGDQLGSCEQGVNDEYQSCENYAYTNLDPQQNCGIYEGSGGYGMCIDQWESV